MTIFNARQRSEIARCMHCICGDDHYLPSGQVPNGLVVTSEEQLHSGDTFFMIPWGEDGELLTMAAAPYRVENQPRFNDRLYTRLLSRKGERLHVVPIPIQVFSEPEQALIVKIS